MPYIKQNRRDIIDDEKIMSPSEISSVGELNYAITSIVDNYLYDNEVSYSTINDCIGALECAKLELYRKVAVPFETQKEFENGAVYTCI